MPAARALPGSSIATPTSRAPAARIRAFLLAAWPRAIELIMDISF